jgi:hypothetical protein
MLNIFRGGTLPVNHISPVSKPRNVKYSVIIPAAGMGSRMKSYGPKSMLKIKPDVTILDNQLKNIYKNLPKVEIIVVHGFEGHRVHREYSNRPNVKCVANPQYETSNVVNSIGVGLQHITTDRVIVIYGDLVFNSHTLQAPFGDDSMVIIDRDNGCMGKDEVGCVVHNNILSRMMYSLPLKWAQIAYFQSKELGLLRKLCAKPEYGMYFGFEIINMIINNGGVFKTYSSKHNKILDVDSSKDLLSAAEII